MPLSVHLVQHCVLDDALAVIRDRRTPNAQFRSHLARMAMILVAEATRTLPTAATTVETPLTSTAVRHLAPQPVVVPVLRAGLGFLPAVEQLLPDADIGFVGMARDEATFAPETYVSRLPADIADRPVLVVDPMLATGGSLLAALELIEARRAGATRSPLIVVCALAAPEGIEHIRESGLDVELFVGAIDDHLNEHAFIVPGLGDAGDRLFGPGA